MMAMVSTTWKAPCLDLRTGFCPVIIRNGKAPAASNPTPHQVNTVTSRLAL